MDTRITTGIIIKSVPLRLARHPPVWSLNSNSASPIDTMHYEEVQGVQVTMTEQQWEEMQEICFAHRRSQQNPAVRTAWEQYRMLRVLSDENHSYMLQK